MNLRACITIFISMSIVFSIAIIPESTEGWSNGGYSDVPEYPDYGTHDWIAQHALDWLPADEKQYLLDNLNSYLYGTELPDNSGPEDGIGDSATHHIYYNEYGIIEDDSSYVRAITEYEKAKTHLENKNYVKAAKYAGIMSHYIADVGVFGHVMGKNTDWGAEEHHSDYESYVTNRMTSYTSGEFDGYLVYDGSLSSIGPNTATKEIAYLTTFGDNDNLKNCSWMDSNYDWGNSVFMDSCGASLNYTVNYLADVLHKLAVDSGYNGEGGQQNVTKKIVISEVYYDTTGTDSDHEYIELYNPTDVSINFFNWEIEDNNFPFVITGLATILPYSYFTIARNGTQFQMNYGYLPDKDGLTLALNNDGDHLRLYNNEGGEIDFVSWEEENPGWDIFANEGFTIRRANPDVDTGLIGDWRSGQSQDPKTQADGSFPPPDNQPPVAAFGTSKVLVNVSEEISFDTSDSYDPDSGTLLYYWDFNASDGVDDDIMGYTITHQYSSPGKYTVTLIVVDTEGAWDNETIDINVVIPNYPPTAVTLYEPLEVTSNSVKITWSQNNDTDFDHYGISIENDTEFIKIGGTDLDQKDDVQYNITGLASNTTYQILIEVFDTAGLMNESNILSVRTVVFHPQDNVDNGEGDGDGGDKEPGDQSLFIGLGIMFLIVVIIVSIIFGLKKRK